MQGLLGGIKDKQRKQQEAHERTKTVTRTGEMKGIRERMQVSSHRAASKLVPQSLAGSKQKLCSYVCMLWVNRLITFRR